MIAYNKEFIEERTQDLYRMQAELRETLQIETNQFHALLDEPGTAGIRPRNLIHICTM